jgi:hypothetical protein
MPRIVSEKAILPLLGISSRTLFQLRKKKVIPFTKCNERVIVYDVDLVLEAKRQYDRISK